MGTHCERHNEQIQSDSLSGTITTSGLWSFTLPGFWLYSKRQKCQISPNSTGPAGRPILISGAPFLISGTSTQKCRRFFQSFHPPAGKCFSAFLLPFHRIHSQSQPGRGLQGKQTRPGSRTIFTNLNAFTKACWVILGQIWQFPPFSALFGNLQAPQLPF